MLGSMGIGLGSFFCLLALAPASQARDLTAESVRTATGFAWLKSESTGVDVFYEAGGKAEQDLGIIKQRLEDARIRVESLLGGLPAMRLQAFLVTSRSQARDLVGFETNGTAFETATIMVHNENTSAVSAHEPCHVWTRYFWGENKERWINEGLAVYSDDQWRGLPLHLVAKWLLDHGRLAPMKDLVKNSWGAKYSELVTYPQLGSFVKFVYERYGRDAVKGFWQRGAGQAKKSMGKTLAEIEKEWLHEIGTLDASAVNYRL
jgi:hypothetical protein